MSSVVPRQGSAVGYVALPAEEARLRRSRYQVMENAANRYDDGSVAVEARQEAPELSQNRVATYSHDNVFARIQSRGANNGHVAGGQLREHSIASLETDMARYQPTQSIIVPSNSNLAGIGAQFEELFKGSSPVPVPGPWVIS
ncbi:hypothetical protein FPCIR_7071 [Fusarium pseudocircinatum]|uniref:Uncharacterized protein n=1 Tax=Fusarium pseudocircinatum TaxID=56676 RepID=A0A8H5LDI1_9HYPO|nr:hypothetical protein FPCIR_7071 [Fusarium pseudocircinatum]